jgi:hypothetical protein
MKETVDPVSQKATKCIVESKGQDLQPQIIVTPPEITFTGHLKKDFCIFRMSLSIPKARLRLIWKRCPRKSILPGNFGKKIFILPRKKLLVFEGALNERNLRR